MRVPQEYLNEKSPVLRIEWSKKTVPQFKQHPVCGRWGKYRNSLLCGEQFCFVEEIISNSRRHFLSWSRHSLVLSRPHADRWRVYSRQIPHQCRWSCRWDGVGVSPGPISRWAILPGLDNYLMGARGNPVKWHLSGQADRSYLTRKHAAVDIKQK